MKRSIFVLIVSLVAAFTVSGQAREITNGEFWRQYRAAVEKPFEISKRVTTKEEYFENGKLSDTTETVTEFLKPDKQHFVETYKSEKSSRKTELIQIGTSFYCRTDNADWKESDRWCANLKLRSLPAGVSYAYTVQETKLNKQAATLYEEYITYKSEYWEGKGKIGLLYFRDKYWVSHEGFILRREMEIGFVESKEVLSKDLDVYEYDLKDIKIEAPVVAVKKKS